MPESPTSSFIPKRGIGNRPTVKKRSNFVLLAVISYALFVSAPLASAAVFIYERHTQNQFNRAVLNLDEAIKNFNQEDLQRVTDFNERLLASKNALENHVSVVSLLAILEKATADTVSYKTIDISRADSANVSVAGILTTPKLDGALFQRSAYNTVAQMVAPEFSEVVLTKIEGETGRNVEFKLEFTVPTTAIKYGSVTDNAVSQQESSDAAADSLMSNESSTTTDSETDTNIYE